MSGRRARRPAGPRVDAERRALTRPTDDAEPVLRRDLKAEEDKDLAALVSCWHHDVQVTHPMRPNLSWSGQDTYRRAWARIWEANPHSRFEVVSTAVDGNRI